MPPIVVLILCVILVVALLRIEGKRNTASSHALWIPTFWMLICGSRPVAGWFEPGLNLESADAVAAGSPIDRLVLGVLIILALLIVFIRKLEWSRILKDNFWLILVFLYLASSILWSDFPFVSIKRWIRSAGIVAMGLVILSERKPHDALESVLRRCAYVLIPFSFVLIKYFPIYGRVYGRWDGLEMWTGVTGHKNSLGQLCMVSAFFLIWALIREWRLGNLFRIRLQAFADALVFCIAVFLLRGPGDSYSATSLALFVLGIATLLLLYWMKNLARLLAAHLKAFTVVIVLLYVFFAELVTEIVASILGRDKTLTGRAIDIWPILLDVGSQNPLLGVGYGSFWGLNPIANNVIGLGQGHNGYLDIFLELGLIGLVLLSIFILDFCGKVRKVLSHSFDWGVFGICILVIVLPYNNSESSFFQTGYLWSSMVLLVVVFTWVQQQVGELPGRQPNRISKGANLIRSPSPLRPAPPRTSRVKSPKIE